MYRHYLKSYPTGMDLLVKIREQPQQKTGEKSKWQQILKEIKCDSSLAQETDF